eukprot:scaffold180132_cov35-Prasinocladus_malaysianus.AAC.2
MTCAMLHHAGLHGKYWGHAIKTAAQIRNRIFHPSVNGIAYELLTGLDLSYIRVFCCLRYVHVDSSRRSKLQDKAFFGFLGADTRMLPSPTSSKILPPVASSRAVPSR